MSATASEAQGGRNTREVPKRLRCLSATAQRAVPTQSWLRILFERRPSQRGAAVCIERSAFFATLCNP
jgi:hypothetical protein